MMRAIEFETEIVNNIICIPQKYKGALPQKARVLIIELTESAASDTCIVRSKRKRAICANDFQIIKIGGSFKLSKEAANEQ